jgi:N-methylhydantoinase B
VKNVPIEVTEAISPLVIWKKEYRQDSGGPGKFRGGLGQTMVVGNREGAEFAIFATYDRVIHPPRGREGGADGMAGRLSLGSGSAMKGMGRQIIPAGDRVVIEMPGGGGYGNPAEREIERIREDVRSGLVSREAAERDYGVVIDGVGDVGQEPPALEISGGGPGGPDRDSGRPGTARTAWPGC